MEQQVTAEMVVVEKDTVVMTVVTEEVAAKIAVTEKAEKKEAEETEVIEGAETAATADGGVAETMAKVAVAAEAEMEE